MSVPPGRGLIFLSSLALAALGCGTSPDSSGASGGAGGSDVAMATGGSSAATGGSPQGGGAPATGGSSSGGSGAESPSGGAASGGASAGGGGDAESGGSGGTLASGGSGGTAGPGGGSSGDGGSETSGGGTFSGTCTESVPTESNASGSGPHDVVMETNSDPGINEGTIFRPADLGGAEKYPIFVWGQGGCSQNGLSNRTAMIEIASHGYFVIADGTPDGTGNRPMDKEDLPGMGAPLIAYIDWAIAENSKPCSAYSQSLDVTKISSNGFSCGGLMAQGTISDSRIVTWGVTSSGMAGMPETFYDLVSTPVLFVEGGPDEVAYDGGLEGYQKISELGVPVLWFSKNIGHGGDLFDPDGGDFTKINLAWLNWWLKGDEGATGKGLLVGAGCPYCSDSAWEVMSANVP